MSSRRLRVLHVMPSFFPAVRYGGPIESVLKLCQNLEPAVDVDVVTTDADGDGSLDVPLGVERTVEGVRVRYFGRAIRTGFAFSPGLLQHLLMVTSEYDLVHVTAAFSFPSSAACFAARRAGVPYVVSPRGSCQAWARGQKRWKKLPYWHLMEHRNLTHAAALHATSDQEAESLRALLPGCRVITVPNGVVVPASAPKVERSATRVLFLGRLHPVKGLDLLIRALSIAQKTAPDLEAVLAGPDDVGEWKRLQSIISGLDPKPRVRYLGPVQGAAKSELLGGATALVLPSHTENFGQVVVEALAHGTPVIASRHTPWEVLEQRGAGLWVDNAPDSLARAMVTLLADPSARMKMGEAGRLLASEFSWPAVAGAMAAMYGELASNRGARP